ncbi:hypothetical protein A4X13_0g1127 [Tilletia indica]|uniref:Uncharacterized protein n=1 Tax=Tilletia indica TaxID=43049 RepID=A0A177TXA4_9BASI|nr:hypothetical protein A4X13_0g1127 [Tilletia indica]
MSSPSSPSPATSSTPPTEPFPFLRLPPELQAQILLHCDYFTLKTLHRVCKSVKRLLKDAMFDKALFRPTLKTLSREALAILAQERSCVSDSVVRVHPAIKHSRWRVRDMSGVIYVSNACIDRDPSVLDTLAARNECATCPAVDRLKVVIRRYGTSEDDFSHLIHEDSEMIEHEASGREGGWAVTMAELARSLFKLEFRWRIEILSWNEMDDDDEVGLPFPDGNDRVSAELLPDGSLAVTQEVYDYVYDDYDWGSSWGSGSYDSP